MFSRAQSHSNKLSNPRKESWETQCIACQSEVQWQPGFRIGIWKGGQSCRTGPLTYGTWHYLCADIVRTELNYRILNWCQRNAWCVGNPHIWCQKWSVVAMWEYSRNTECVSPTYKEKLSYISSKTLILQQLLDCRRLSQKEKIEAKLLKAMNLAKHSVTYYSDQHLQGGDEALVI